VNSSAIAIVVSRSDRDKEGKFLKADREPLFLDEVGDMSLKTQSKSCYS